MCKTATTLIIILLVGLVIACQPTPAPTSTLLPIPTPMLFTPPQPGDGTDLIDRLLEKGIIRVGIRVWPEADFSPPAFRGASNAAIGGALTGFEVELAHHIADGLGLELELVEAYPPVIAGGDWRGEWDIAIASLTPFDQPPNVMYSEPYGYIPMGMLVPAVAEPINSIDQLAGRRVGVFEHTPYQRLLTPEEGELTVQGQPLLPEPPNVRLIVLSNVQRSIRQLGQPPEGGEETTSQIDAIFGPLPVLQQAVESGLPVEVGQSVGLQPLSIAVVPQDKLTVERLIAEINTILHRLNRQGTLSEMYLEWYNQDYTIKGEQQ